MKKLITILAALSLTGCMTGCAGLNQAVQAYGSIAVTNAKAANDTLIDGYKIGVCALPLSAILRNPEIIPAVRSLCVAPSDKNAAELLGPDK